MSYDTAQRLARHPLERLQRRLERALDEAATAERLHRKTQQEIEISGLHQEDLEIIRAWLVRNDQWVHACQELIYPRPSCLGKPSMAVRCLRCGLQVNDGQQIERCPLCMTHKVCSTDTCAI
jgi:rubrerythrin